MGCVSVTPSPSNYQKHQAERRARLALIAKVIAREARLASIALALAEATEREQHESERDLVI